MESEEGMDTDALALDLRVEYGSNWMSVTDRGDGSNYRLRRVSNGRLDCMSCKTDWCEHIQQAIEQDIDHPLVLQENVELPQMIHVPLVPTQSQWATVIYKSVTDYGAYEVALVVPAATDEFLGYVYRNEGRAVLRSMVYNWFLSNTTHPDVKWYCTVTAHRYAADRKLQADLKSGGAAALAQQWSIWNTSRCLVCDEATKRMMSEAAEEGF